MKKASFLIGVSQIVLALLTLEPDGFCQQRSYYWTQKGNYYYDNNIYPELEFGYYSKGVAAGEPGSVVMLAYCYLNEHGTQRNVKKAQQLLDAWATKSDVTAFAAMKFYLPAMSEFNYIQSVGYDEIPFPFGEKFGVEPDMTKALKSLRYLEDLCDNDKLVDIYERYARELISRVKIYCHEKNIGGIHLCGADYVSEQLLSGHYWLGRDTVLAMFNRCTCIKQVDSVRTVLLGLHQKAEKAKVADYYYYPDMIKDASWEWTSPQYAVFTKCVAEKDSAKCAASYLALDNINRAKADDFLSKYYKDSVRNVDSDSLFFQKSVEFHSFCPSDEMRQHNIIICNHEITKVLRNSVDEIRQGEFEGLTQIKKFNDAVRLVTSVKSCASTEDERKSIISQYATDVIDVGCEDFLEKIGQLSPTSDFFKEESGNGVVFCDGCLGDGGWMARELEEYRSAVKYTGEFSSFFDGTQDLIKIANEKDDIEYKIAVCRYVEYYAFISVLSKVKEGTDKYEDYGILHSISEEYKALVNDSQFGMQGRTDFDMVLRYFQPFEQKALLVYQDECAISAADKLTINSSKEEISAVLQMPMTKSAKEIVKEKTKKSYLKSKSL